MDAQELIGAIGRRRFLQLLGASAAGLLVGCAPRKEDTLVPYVHQPEGVGPGKVQHFASALPYLGFARGVLVESVMGRPVKVDGNPDHPSSLGGSDVLMQSSLMDLYDPDRPAGPLYKNQARSLQDFFKNVHSDGLHILSRSVTSPTLKRLIAESGAKWHRYQPVWPVSRAFARSTHVHYKLEGIATIVSFEGDFLGTHPDRLRLIREFAAARRSDRRPRLYVYETAPSLTGAQADQRTALSPAGVERALFQLAAGLGVIEGPSEPSMAGLVADLRRGGVVVAGECLSAGAQALAQAINARIKAPVTYTEAVDDHPLGPQESLVELVSALQAGQVKTLLILGGNPVYDAPADSGLAEAMRSAGVSAYHGILANETSAACQWLLPASHELEAWGDLRAYDGTASLVQPLIEPLYNSTTASQLLHLLGGGKLDSYTLVRQTWKLSEKAWKDALNKGVLPGTAAAKIQPSLLPLPKAAPIAAEGLSLVFAPDFNLVDGEGANNPWLQECPRPLSKLVWGNGVQMSPSTAGRLGLVQDGLVTLKTASGEISGPVFLEPCQPDEVLTVHLGYGRQVCGKTGLHVGFSAYPLRAGAAQWWTPVSLTSASGKEALVSTQLHHRIEGRDPIHFGPAGKIELPEEPKLTILPGSPMGEVAWGMVIDLTSCVGCNACMVACQAENNVPTVGKEEVSRGRSMHWIRIDRYNTGLPPTKSERRLMSLLPPTPREEGNVPMIHFQPVPCMHCEDAPCEKVCPVGATSHSEEGLNQMVYNRCVGTRYCSNNCPYKVRRFNFFRYVDPNVEVYKMARNPEVTVRDRGVMEKCTYCVQRIDNARIKADIENRPIRDGEVKVACQVACPAQAISFGNLADPDSEVSKAKKRPYNFALLGELNTRPRTTYLARITNPPETHS